MREEFHRRLIPIHAGLPLLLHLPFFFPLLLLFFFLLPSISTSPCPSCPFEWTPPLEGRSRGEGMVGETMTTMAPSTSWSTQWTMKPWSWSSSGNGGGGGGGGATTAASPMEECQECKEECRECGAEENGDGGDDNMMGKKRQGYGGGGMMHRFCFRHPGHPKCQGFPPPGPDFGPPPPPHWPPPPGPPPPGPPPPPPPPFRPSFMRPMPEDDNGVQPETPTMPFGYLPAEARDAMLANCMRGNVDCRAQPYGMEQKRTMVLQHEMDFMRRVSPYKSPEMIEKRVDLVHRLKQKMLHVAGLGEHVTPINDGTFEHDILLTEGQAMDLLNALDATPAPAESKRYGYGRRYKRASLFLEQLQAQKWPSGESIKYFFDPTIQDFEQQMVHQAHLMIEAQTCIRFEQVPNKPATDYLHYIKVSTPTFCGLSYIGRVSPANPIYLSFQCQDPVGVAAHETMHALGANHEHLRSDRDEHIDVQWANINPQFYDFFAIADPSKFTPYGVPYSYDSIMHYGPHTASLDNQKPTMVPRVDPQRNMALMGQRRRLSDKDVQMLNAMNCKPPGCEDRHVYCGVWSLRGFCSTRPQQGWMRQNCMKSCKMC